MKVLLLLIMLFITTLRQFNNHLQMITTILEQQNLFFPYFEDILGVNKYSNLKKNHLSFHVEGLFSLFNLEGNLHIIFSISSLILWSFKCPKIVKNTYHKFPESSNV